MIFLWAQKCEEVTSGSGVANLNRFSFKIHNFIITEWNEYLGPIHQRALDKIDICACYSFSTVSIKTIKIIAMFHSLVCLFNNGKNNIV